MPQMMTVSTHFNPHSNHPTFNSSDRVEEGVSQPIVKEQANQKSLSPALSRLVLLAAAIAVWGAAGLVVSQSAHAQAGPYPPMRGGYGPGPGNGYGPGPGPEASSESIANLQRQLADLGYFNGEITGYYGPQTREAIVRFQQDMGLAADGIVGPETAQALSQGEPPDGSPYDSEAPEAGGGTRLDDSGDQVAELQQRLADLGYYSGDISGVFDYPTEAAVMQFQRDNGLETDGVVGPNTEDALRRPSEEIMRPAEAPTSESPTSEIETADPQASNSVSPDSQANLLGMGDSGEAVSELQSRLQELGFYQGALTGMYDPETEAAVIAFQQSQGLTTDGIAGPQVNSALYNPVNFTASNTAATTAPATTAPMTTGMTAGTTTVPSQTNAVVPATGSPQFAQTSPTASTPQFAQTSPTVNTPQFSQTTTNPEQLQPEAEQATATLNQNFSEGRYSVAELQRRLRNDGMYEGEINGILDSGTQAAIDAAQREHGLSQSDLYGSTESAVAPAF